MRNRSKLSVLLLGLTLVLFGPACRASSLGLTVHVVPLDTNEGKTVRAHFSAIAPGPCPSLSGLCSEDEDCLVHKTSFPFKGTKPGSGWCVRQWQKTVPSNYSATINLGARADCPQKFHLSVKDPDGDIVTCRFARPDQGECLNCTQHSFIEVDEDKCLLTFTGNAPAGQYFIYLMAEDRVFIPKIKKVIVNNPLSAVPVHLSLTVEESTYSCTDEPVAAGETPREDTTLFVLPYHQVQFNTDFTSQRETVSEVAVVGPPDLFRIGFKSVGPLAVMTMAWVRSENKLPRLLPICFAANTNSLQSKPRCVWLYQREMRMLPDGTVLTCEKTEMTLVLPVSSLDNIDLAELQLNSPTCPISYNNTHLTATISLTGCGTKTVHSGSELVYTNTLQSVRPYTKVSRQPSLVLPLACRIPGVQAKGPQYEIGMPLEKETFGEVTVWLEVHLPGEGPMGEFTRIPKFRSLQMAPRRKRRETESTSESNSNTTTTGSRISKLDLQVMSNCNIDRAEVLVSSCIESETKDFEVYSPILEQGCTSSNSTLEVVTTQNNAKVYRIDLSTMQTKGSTMYVRCTVNLCVATLPSALCPDLCTRSFDTNKMVSSVFTGTYTINSGPVSLMVTTPAPATTTTVTTTTTPTTTTTTTTTTTSTDTDTTTTTTENTTTSHAPERASSTATGLILTTICIFLQNILR
ncbi:mucin-2-like [Anoplopoma fimbria]|uniref:mucin-2-like n=1 Tax=Anoplopoma fimbria TaxID=229290 RepID=UPI0023EBB7F9|nr:mucin-2-like [Anoplopoma fimbria]